VLFILLFCLASTLFLFWARTWRWQWFLTYHDEQAHVPKQEHITVGTFNLHLFFLWTQPRMTGIAMKLLSTKADVLCLQEVWDVLAFKRLDELVRYSYPFSCSSVTHGDLKGSGLVIFSRFPIRYLHFWTFAHHDKSSNKGIVLLKINGIAILCGHFPEESRIENFHILADAIFYLGDEALIIVGDFNIDFQAEPEFFKEIKILSKMHNAFECPQSTYKDQTLDYIFYNNLSCIEYQLIDMEGLSDHQGLRAEFELE
jgi:endonuclease/exonuclease/phosphatase family metal-dependent hydrolase